MIRDDRGVTICPCWSKILQSETDTADMMLFDCKTASIYQDNTFYKRKWCFSKIQHYMYTYTVMRNTEITINVTHQIGGRRQCTPCRWFHHFVQGYLHCSCSSHCDIPAIRCDSFSYTQIYIIEYERFALNPSIFLPAGPLKETLVKFEDLFSEVHR